MDARPRRPPTDAVDPLSGRRRLSTGRATHVSTVVPTRVASGSAEAKEDDPKTSDSPMTPLEVLRKPVGPTRFSRDGKEARETQWKRN